MEVKEQQVRGGVNEKALISAIGHLFNNSFMALAELMQNARRAKASSVRFDIDPKNKRITVSDDGMGVKDFSKLIVVAESGWNDQTKLSESPFGMGLMAAFAIAQSVTVRSNGLTMTATLQDIACKRLLHASKNLAPMLNGAVTVIILDGVNAEIWQQQPQYGPAFINEETDINRLKILSRLKAFARGFAIPVFVNGEELPRPDAQSSLQGEQTGIGFVQMAGIHSEVKENVLLSSMRGLGYRNLNARIYLQGLPVMNGSEISDGAHVVHLDNSAFIARMPDRSHLFNEDKQFKTIRDAMLLLAQNYLARQKAVMNPFEFVQKHWTDCSQFAMLALLNDVPWLPEAMLTLVGQVAYWSSEVDSPFFSPLIIDGLIAREHLTEGRVKVWLNAPDSACEDVKAPMILKLMQSLDIAMVSLAGIDDNHWLFKSGFPNVEDIVVDVQSVGSRGEGSLWLGNVDVDITIVEAVDVQITSTTDTALRINHRLLNDWLMVPVDGSEVDSEHMRLYYPVTNKSPDSPVNAVQDFTDENDNYQDDWELAAHDEFRAKIAGLLGGTLDTVIGGAITSIGLPLQAANLSQMLAVRLGSLWSDHENCYRRPQIETVDLEDASVWENMCSGLQGQPITGESLKAAFSATIKAGQRIGGPEGNVDSSQ